MKKTDWKGIAELIGIGAIFLSLMFVGAQLRQDRMFAQSQATGDYLENRLELRANMNNFVPALVKGNSGAQLDPTEVAIVRNIVQNEQDLVFLQLWRVRESGGLSSNTPELLFAVFLHRNPAAREAWLQIGSDIETLVDPLRSAESLRRSRETGSAAFRVRIKSYLAKLDTISS